MSQPTDLARWMVTYPYYLSPEMCKVKLYDEKSDIWALGCILYEMCAQKYPFEANNKVSSILKVVKGKVDPIPTEYSSETAQIVEVCLYTNYQKRPSADDLLNSPALIAKARELNISFGPDPQAILEVVAKKKETIHYKEPETQSKRQR